MQSSTPPDLSWLQCRSKQESQAPALELLARDTLETNPITVKPNPESHMVKQSSVPLPCCSPPRPLPNKVLLYQHMCLLGQLLSECQTEALEGIPIAASLMDVITRHEEQMSPFMIQYFFRYEEMQESVSYNLLLKISIYLKAQSASFLRAWCRIPDFYSELPSGYVGGQRSQQLMIFILKRQMANVSFQLEVVQVDPQFVGKHF